MPRPQNKEQLIEAAETNFAKLWQTIEAMPEPAMLAEFDFSNDSKRTEAHWQRDKNIRDILVHLYEWHQLLIHWVNANIAGNSSHFLPKPYTWKSYGDMNIAFWEKHQQTPLNQAQAMTLASHQQVIDLVQTFSNEALFTKKYFDWTGTTSLGSYCVSAMPSHYDWAMKKIRLHVKKHPPQ